MAAAPVPERLPPGVYFNPAPSECVTDYLLPWVQGEDMRAARGVISGVDIYGHSPDALRRRHPPGRTRAFEHKWFFLTHCVRQSGGRRASRGVATGGHWKVEQTAKVLLDAAGRAPVGRRRSYGFYAAAGEKTQWLMEEFVADGAEEDSGGERRRVKVLCGIYVSPRASDDERWDIFGEDGIALDRDGNKKPARVVIPEAYFDAVAARLPASCRRYYGGQGPAAPPPQQTDVLGLLHGQHPLPPLPDVPGPQHGRAVVPQGIAYLHPYLGLYQPATSSLPGPQQGMDMIHIKKARLAYGWSPPAELQRMNGAMSTDEFEVSAFQEPGIMMKHHSNEPCIMIRLDGQEDQGRDAKSDDAVLHEPAPVPTPTPPPQEKPAGTPASASSSSDDTLPPLMPELAVDARQEADEPLRGGLMDVPQMAFSDAVLDCGLPYELPPPFDGEFLPLLENEFRLEHLGMFDDTPAV